MSQIGNISGKHIGQGNVHQQSETSEVRSSATSASNAVQNKDLYESSQVTDVHAAILAQPVSAPDAPMTQEAVNGANSFAHQISDLGPIGNNETVLTAQFLKLQMLAGEYDSDMANHVSQMQSGMLQSMHRQRIDLGQALHTEGPGLEQQANQYSQMAQQESAKAQQILGASGVDAATLQDIAIDVASEEGYDTESELSQAEQDALKAKILARYEEQVGPLSPQQRLAIEQAMPHLQAGATYGLIAEEASSKLNGIKSGIAQAETAISSTRPGGAASAKAARVKESFKELSDATHRVAMGDNSNLRADRRDGMAELEKARLEMVADLFKLIEKHNQTQSEQINYIS